MAASEVPGWLRERLGPMPELLPGEGGGKVLRGNGVVAKTGPPEALAREALVLTDLRDDLPLAVPALLDQRDGWLVMEDVADTEEPWSEAEVAAAVGDLARLHTALEGHAVASDPRLGDPLGRDLGPALQRARGAASALRADLPDVAALALRPDPVVEILTAGGPRTLLHGDPWPTNVRRHPERGRVWLDWGHAGVGPPALDVASWLDQAPWALGWTPDPSAQIDAYGPADPAAFRRAVDAASAFWLVVVDVPALPPLVRSDPELAQEVVAGRRAALARLGL